MNKLIAAVKARQCLWDKSYRGHCSRSKLERYWNEVAAEVGTSSVNCQKKWKNLKDQCQKEIKKNVNNSDWPHFHTLKFIHHHFLEDDIINKLIDLVQVREIIWNRQVEGHHNRYKIDESWKEIAQELNVTGVYCRKRWKYLKDQCRKEIKENANNSDWPHFHKLKFIHHHFLEDDMNKLIDLVQVREIIWNRQVEGHYNRNKLDESWKEIAQELNVTRVNCQKKWKNLKDQCQKEIKKNVNNSDWPHFHTLKFIHHHFLEDDIINKLIDLVQVREIIWNRQVEGHHNRYKIDESWKEIAQELNVTGVYCRKRWKYLKDQCRKEIKENANNSDWPHFHKLKFIHHHFLEDDMNKLIDLVQVREIIWNRQVEGHYNRNKLDESWKEIAQELNVTRVNCQVRWKHLIQYCRKEIKKNANNSDWPHFHKLKFIHHQLLVDDDEDGEDTNGDVFNSLDDSMKRPKLGYTMRKKLLMDKRKIDMNKLIDLVQVREIIWNKQLEDHHNRYKVHECWMEIAQELNVTGLKARLKWKYLRDHATKEVRKQKSKWKFLPKLQFYTNQFKDYEGNENQELELKEEHFQEEDHFEIEEHFEDAPPEPSAEYFNIEEPKIAIVDTVSIKDDEFDKFVCDLIII